MMIDLVDDFETRIRILSKSLREQVDKKEVVKKVKSYHANAESIDLDGRTNIGTFVYDETFEDFMVLGRKGPSTWIGKYIAELFPTKRIHLTWVSIEWKRGSVIYTYDGSEFQEDERKFKA